MQHNVTEVSCLSIRPDRICLYSKLEGWERCYSAPKLTGSAIRDRQKGLSRKAARRLKDAINTLIYLADWKSVYVKDSNKRFRFKVSFITLTLPSSQVHKDKEIHNTVFKPFMADWVKVNPGMLYVWKAEVQDNGNIHYHITSNIFIHHRKLRTRWNRAINKLGYIDRCNTDNPNSTDVHSVIKVRNLAAYLVKYLSKGDIYSRLQKRYLKRYKRELGDKNNTVCRVPSRWFTELKRIVEIQPWGASKALLDAKAIVVEPTGIIDKEVRDLWQFKALWNEYDYCRVMYLDNNVLNELPGMARELKTQLASKYNIKQVSKSEIIVNSLK